MDETDPEELTPEETVSLREMLKKHKAESAPVKFFKRLPGIGKYWGKIGRFVVYASIFNLALTICLIPQKIEQNYQYYAPKVAWVYDKAREALSELEKRAVDPDSLPPTKDYIVLREPPPTTTTTTTTTTTPPPSGSPSSPLIGTTVVASTGLPPDILGGSGVVSPPSTWT